MSTLIVDYGLCNIDSVVRAVEECGGCAVVSDDPRDAKEAEKIILPGVGNFAVAMRALRRNGWDVSLRHEALVNGIPLLGICLGMQLLASRGKEGGDTEGLDLIPGEVVRLKPESANIRVPHIGWNEVAQKRSSLIFMGIPDRKDFFFVHSYHFVPADASFILATTPYDGTIVSAVCRNHIYGTQFHPEKSLGIGLRLLRNFLIEG
jgi:glutamine amidotransferase